MNFGRLLNVAEKNRNASAAEKTVKRYSTEVAPAKKLPKSNVQFAQIRAFLQRKEQEEKQKQIEEMRKKEKLLELRAQNSKSNKRAKVMASRTKDNNFGRIRLTEDEEEARQKREAELQRKMLTDKVERMKARIKLQQEEEEQPHKRKRKRRTSAGEPVVSDEATAKQEPHERKPRKRKYEIYTGEDEKSEDERPAPRPVPRPPPMTFNYQDLLRLANEKKNEPVVVERLAPPTKEEHRPLTKQEKERKMEEELHRKGVKVPSKFPPAKRKDAAAPPRKEPPATSSRKEAVGPSKNDGARPNGKLPSSSEKVPGAADKQRLSEKQRAVLERQRQMEEEERELEELERKLAERRLAIARKQKEIEEKEAQVTEKRAAPPPAIAKKPGINRPDSGRREAPRDCLGEKRLPTAEERRPKGAECAGKTSSLLKKPTAPTLGSRDVLRNGTVGGSASSSSKKPADSQLGYARKSTAFKTQPSRPPSKQAERDSEDENADTFYAYSQKPKGPKSDPPSSRKSTSSSSSAQPSASKRPSSASERPSSTSSAKADSQIRKTAVPSRSKEEERRKAPPDKPAVSVSSRISAEELARRKEHALKMKRKLELEKEKEREKEKQKSQVSTAPSASKKLSYEEQYEDLYRRLQGNYIESEEDDEEYEDEEDDMDDFIDDTPQSANLDYSKHIREIFGYDRSRFQDDDDDEAMESSYAEQMKEEVRSARIGLKEDIEDMKREEEELRQKQMRKLEMMRKMRRKI